MSEFQGDFSFAQGILSSLTKHVTIAIETMRISIIEFYSSFFHNLIQITVFINDNILNNLPEIKENRDYDIKLNIIKKIKSDFSQPSHPISIAMKKMREDVEEVRIIEGLENG